MSPIAFTHSDIPFEYNGLSLEIGEHTNFFSDTSPLSSQPNKVCTVYDNSCSSPATHVTTIQSGNTWKVKADKNYPPGYTE